jgi:type I restriction enzyme S subunit
MELKPRYKQTAVGVIPEDWVVRPIGAVCKLINGRGFKPFEWQKTGLPIIRIQNLNGSDDFNYFTGSYDQKLEVKPGQLLFAWSGSRGTSFGPHMWQGPLGLLNYHTWKVQTYDSEISKEFFLHALRQLTAFIEGKAHGVSALVHTQKWEMEAFELPIPPMKDEQVAIAEALSDADILIESLEQLLNKKRYINQGTKQELLMGKRRLPGFSGEWELKRIADIAFSSLEKNSLGESLPVLACSKHLGFVDSLAYFKNRVFSRDTTGYKLIRRGQIGYPSNHIEEGSIGLQDLYDAALVSPIYVIFTVAEGVDSYFLHRLLKLDSFRQRFSTATTSSVDRRGSLRWPAFSEISVSLPQIEEQTAIAIILRDMDAEIAALEAKLAKARQLKQGMMQELLTGRIRLV